MFLLIDLFIHSEYKEDYNKELIDNKCKMLDVWLNKGTKIIKDSHGIHTIPVYFTDSDYNYNTTTRLCKAFGLMAHTEAPFAICEKRRGGLHQVLRDSNGNLVGAHRVLRRVSYEDITRTQNGLFYFINGAYYGV